MDCPFIRYKNIAGRFFGLVTKHACDKQTDRITTPKSPRPRYSIAASRGKTVRHILSDRCLSALSVTLVCCGQTVRWIKMKLGMELGLGPGHIVLDGDPAPTIRQKKRRGHRQERNHVFKVGGPIPWSRLLYRTNTDGNLIIPSCVHCNLLRNVT